MIIGVSILLAFFALFGVSSTAWAEPVKINDKPLDDIHDIMTATAGTRTFRKHSIIKPMWYKPNLYSDSGSYLRSFFTNIDGISGAVQFDPSSVITRVPPVDSEWTSGMHPAVSTKTVADGLSYRVVLPDFSHHGHDRCYYTYTVSADRNGRAHTSEVKKIDTKVPAGNVYPTDASAGLFVDGETDESFVVARMTVHEGGKTHLGDKTTRYDFYLEFLDGKKLESGAADPNAASYSVGFAYALYPAIRVVAGDFDHDGIASEVACIRPTSSSNYSFEVFKVSRSSSDTFNIAPMYSQLVGHRDNDGKNIDGCDIAAGDFNGDGKQEIALVFNDLYGSDGHATIQIFYRDGGAFHSKYNAVRDNKHRLGGTNFSVYNKYFGLIADTGDLDGDGRDEIVYTAPRYGDLTQGNLIVSAWGTDDSFHPSELSMLSPGILVDSVNLSCFLLRSVSIALAPVTANMGGIGASCADLLISHVYQHTDIGGHIKYPINKLHLLKSLHHSSGSFIGFEKDNIIFEGKDGWADALLTADFAAESLVLGEPTHMVVRDKKTYESIMQTPAYHVDYIPVPWNAADPVKPALTNFTYTNGETKYSKSTEQSTTRDIEFNATQFAERGFSLGLSVGGTIKKLAGFSFGADASAGWKKTATQSLNKANQSKTTIQMSSASSTGASDNFSYFEADFHIWRYPVIEPAPYDLYGAAIGGEIAGDEDGTNYFTYTMTDEARHIDGKWGVSSQFDEYNPRHEEGNLFSYPTKIENVPGYAEKQIDLSDERGFTVGGGNSSATVSFAKQLTNIAAVKTTAKNEKNRSISFNLGWPKILDGSLSLSGAFGDEIGDTSTFTKSYLSSEEIQVTVPPGNLTLGQTGHVMNMRAYSDAAGVMNMAFAVDLNSSGQLWSAGGSVYSAKPDPALVLPAKFTLSNERIDGSDISIWRANPNSNTATQVRGVWFYDTEAQEYSSAALIKGRKYEISFPVYNASFVDIEDSVQVEVGYKDGSGTKTRIDVCEVQLGGWKRNTENNKATASFYWTPTADMKEGNYDFYFQIDPLNKIDEIHEDWNTTSGDAKYDPAGNNLGRSPFAVLDKAPSDVIIEIRSAGDAEREKTSTFTVTIDGMSPADFMDSLAGRDDDFRAFATVTYNGDEPLRNVFVEVMHRPDESDEDGEHILVANRSVPAIFPGKQYQISFVVSPSKLRNARLAISLKADNATLTTVEQNDDDEKDGGGSSGCDTGTGLLALAFACASVVTRRARKKI